MVEGVQQGPVLVGTFFIFCARAQFIYTSLGRVFPGLGLARFSVLGSSGALLGTMGTLLLSI